MNEQNGGQAVPNVEDVKAIIDVYLSKSKPSRIMMEGIGLGFIAALGLCPTPTDHTNTQG